MHEAHRVWQIGSAPDYTRSIDKCQIITQCIGGRSRIASLHGMDTLIRSLQASLISLHKRQSPWTFKAKFSRRLQKAYACECL